MSLRIRLLLATAIIALVALVGADIATYELLQSSLYRQVDTSLSLSHRSVEESITEPQSSIPPPPSPAPGTTHPATCRSFDGESIDTHGLAPGTVTEVRAPTGNVVYRCATTELDTLEEGFPVLRAANGGRPAASGGHGDGAAFFTAPGPDGHQFRVQTSVLTSGPAKGDQLFVAVPLAGTLDVLGTLRLLEAAATAIALAVALGLGLWLVRVGLRPLRDVERTAEAIAAGQLNERVPGDQARTEVGRVARALNVMLERIQAAFAERDRTVADLKRSEERMRQFIADASHELRTPLAAVSAYAELFDRGAAERPDDLRRVLSGIRSESARMRHLVEDLLVLAHLDEDQPLVLEEIDLVDVAADAVETARTVGPEWPVTLSASDPVPASVDAGRIRQVLDNLLGNVRVHTPAGTSTTVRVADDGDAAVLEVADDGPGLSTEAAGRIFERFFRADPSRSRAHGGAGLCLAIVQSIVSAHGGAVAVSGRSEGGACFTVRVPKAPLGEEAARVPTGLPTAPGLPSPDPHVAPERASDGAPPARSPAAGPELSGHRA